MTATVTRGQPIEPVEHGVAARKQRLDLRHIGDAAELRDIGAGDEAAGFAERMTTPHGGSRSSFSQDRVEFGQHVFRQRVGARIFFVEQEPDGAVFVGAHAPMRPRARLSCGASSIANGPSSRLRLPRMARTGLAGAMFSWAPAQIASISMAPPWPPPMHSVAMPRL